MKKALLIVNPSSGGERAKAYEEKARKKLELGFDKILIKHTAKAGDATKFAREACKQNFHSVFAMGGDGTVSEALSGIAEQKHRPFFGFFPLGTVNDLARALGVSLSPDRAIEELDYARYRAIDIGKINDKYFMNVIAIGTIPEAINNVESKDKTKWGALAYSASAIKQAINMQYYKFLLEIDGKAEKLQSSTILFGLTNSIGGFENILPGAEVDDGLLHMICLKDSKLVESIKAVPNLLSGIEDSTKNVMYATFREAKVSLLDDSESLSVNVDGDRGDELPIQVGILPSHIFVYCGKKR